MAGNLQNVAVVSKGGLLMYGTEGAGGLASSTNQLVNQLVYFVTCITRGNYYCIFPTYVASKQPTSLSGIRLGCCCMLLPNETFDVKNVMVHHPVY